jgi:hypothetical protein
MHTITTLATHYSILPIRKIRLATVRFRATPPAFSEISNTFTAGSVLNALLVVLHRGRWLQRSTVEWAVNDKSIVTPTATVTLLVTIPQYYKPQYTARDAITLRIHFNSAITAPSKCA